MKENQHFLTELLEITEEISKQAKSIDLNMKQNEPEQLEHLQLLVEKRDKVITQFDLFMKQQKHQWSEEDQEKIQKLKEYEQTLQPLLNKLYQSFLEQINRFNQNKQVSKKYIGSYKNMTTDGSFIDKRK